MAAKTVTKTTRNQPATGGATSVTTRGMDYYITRALPLSVAPVLFTALAPGISLMHHVWGGDPMTTPFYTLGVAGAGMAATGYTWVTAGKRKHLRYLGAATAAAVTTATTAGVVVGFSPMAEVYGLGAVALSVLWGIRQGMKWGAGEQGDSGHQLGKLGEVIDSERFKFSRLRGTGNGVIEAKVEAEVGSTIDEAQALTPIIAAAAKVPAGAATIRQDPDNAGVGYLRMAVADLLKAGLPFNAWEGAGKSVCDTIDVGRYEHGDPVEVQITAHEDGGVEHLLLMGVSGAGKSAFARALITRLLTRSRVAVIGIDTAKGLQTFGPMVHGMSMVILDMPTARRFIKAMSGVITARTDHLTREGLDYWTPKSSLTFLVIWAEEAADLMPSADAYSKLLRAARSAGIWIVSSLQRATHDNLPTDARANHGAGMCMGVRELADAQLVLPDEVIEAGAVPTWKARRKGYGYVTGIGTDEDNWATKMRGYDTRNKADIAAAITAAASIRTPLDEITTRALGPLWEHRTVYTEPVGVDVPDVDDTDPADLTGGEPDTHVVEICQQILAEVGAADPAEPRQAVFETALRNALRANPDVDVQTLAEALNTLIEHANQPAAQQPAPAAAPQPTTAPRTAPQPAARVHDEITDETHDEDEDIEMEMNDAARAEVDDARAELEEMLAASADEHLAAHGLDDDQADTTPETQIQDVPEGANFSLRTPEQRARNKRLSVEESRQVFEAQLAEWLAAGKLGFTVKDLGAKGGFLERIGREKTWFYRNKDRYIDAGIIAEDEDRIGEYDILRDPTAPVPAGV
ncbi:FtsK/SpoIIIE domain-containing protein [Actinomadura sp. WAC 06369]|uniref:FtsK/SpoIIIE domain-containing protein n=1 Tax=Actinomadura sp. WAC 06369 TaxID=2203193 RepID=UPI000F7AEF77|nr:FtsK/SpoIIIE domain-containing protein [Actinomadura sp. WAC 06369]RSN53311.1 hypothetical protein DMH08_27660 [Actinomadura sp. WAC 06369]